MLYGCLELPPQNRLRAGVIGIAVRLTALEVGIRRVSGGVTNW